MQLSNLFSAAGAGPAANAGAGKKYKTMTLHAASAAPDTVTALQTSPDNTTWTTQDTVTGSGWGYAAMHLSTQYVRANVTALGTGGLPCSAVVMALPA